MKFQTLLYIILPLLVILVGILAIPEPTGYVVCDTSIIGDCP